MFIFIWIWNEIKMLNARKFRQPPFKTRGMIDRFGLNVLFFLLILNPFHYVLTSDATFLYYREDIAAIFLILSIVKFLSDSGSDFGSRVIIRKELFFAILFPLLLIIFKISDSGRNLYNDADTLGASAQLEKVDRGMYVLRNALLYIPMLVYISLRGLSEREIQKIALLTVLVAPFSVLGYLYYEGLATLDTLDTIVGMGGSRMSYNSYIPYLTYPILSAVYLFVSEIVIFWCSYFYFYFCIVIY